MKAIMPALFVLMMTAAASAATLMWDLPLEERIEITRTARVRFLVNDRQARLYDERNIIDLVCKEKKNESNMVAGRFSVYEREDGEKVFHKREEYQTRFEIDARGRFTVPKEYTMPNLRHIPTFPAGDVRVGETWTEHADLVLTNFSIPFKLSFPTTYRLEEMRMIDGIEVAIISYTFNIDINLIKAEYPADFPLKILGKEEGRIWWDVAEKRPQRMKEKYRIIFFFDSGTRALSRNEFQMIIDTAVKRYRPVTKEEQEKDKSDLKKEVPDGVDVDSDTRGLVLRLGDVLFDFDSAALRNDSREKLERIADILKKKYSDREVIVEGHTDSIGTDAYNRKLSRERAKSVAEYLKPRAGTDKLSYRGFGAERPIAPNDSDVGRQKNRRVEIIIKLR